jgi:hypothetical protein
VHTGSYIDHSVLLADDNWQLSDWAGRQYCSCDMQELYAIPCATFMLLQSHYSARNPSCAHTCPTVSWSRCQRALPSQDVPRVGRIKDVPRVTEVQVQGSFTKGKPIAVVASPVTPSVGHLSSCTYPCQSYKRCAGWGPPLTVASCGRHYANVRRYQWKTLCAGKNSPYE